MTRAPVTTGQRVRTPQGTGRVAYQRFGPPSYTQAEAVSVILDAKRRCVGYSGTIFSADAITPIGEEEERAEPAP